MDPPSSPTLYMATVLGLNAGDVLHDGLSAARLRRYSTSPSLVRGIMHPR